VGTAEDQNFKDVCIWKAFRHTHLNLAFSILSITLCVRYVFRSMPEG